MHRYLPEFSASASRLKLRRPPPSPLEKLLAEKRRPCGRFYSSRSPPFLDGQLDAYGDLLSLFIGSSSPSHFQSLHVHLFKKGFAEDIFLSNNLINSYARTSHMEDAHRVFDEIPEKNVVSWTCLIAGYTQNGFAYEACRLFRSMLSSGFAPTHFTFGSVLRACMELGPEYLALGEQIHGLILKMLYGADTVVCNALVSMYGGCCLDSTRYARLVFDGALVKNSISWNSIITVHSQRGDVVPVFQLFSEMQMCDLRPNEYTFGSLITATYSSCSSCLVEQMLARVCKSGFLSDLYVGSALVSALARNGLLDEARKFLRQMSERNAVTMNGLMVGLIRQGRGEEAVDVFRETCNPLDLNCDSYVVLLSAIAEFSTPEEGWRRGREVHGLVTRTGLIDSKVAIGNGLVNMYAKCSANEEACNVFQNMSTRDQISWNSMIAGHDQNNYFEEAMDTFRDMIRSGVMPTNYATISMLSSCASLRHLCAGSQVHCAGIRLGLDFDVSVSNSLLNLYGECGDLSDCWKVFRSMPSYDQVSWNCMIGVLADSETSASESIEVFLNMMRSGWRPNRVTFVNLFAALTPLSVSSLGREVHALAHKYGVSDYTAVENALIYCYAKSGEMDDCERIFHNMSSRRDDVSWNSMVAGYIHNGLMAKVMDFVWLMVHNGQKMDCFTVATVLSACASAVTLKHGMELHAFSIRSLSETDVVLDSALVDMYSKCGRIDYASTVFRSMPLKNEFSWNSMISGYAQHGHGEKALELFREMQSGNQRPDHVTFVGVLSACSHAGLVEQGLNCFGTMTNKYELIPRMEHYSCIVDLLGRAGKLDKLEEFIKSMPVSPNILIWRTVLVACSRSKDGAKTNLWKQASKMLLELEPQNPVNYVLTSHMYASKGRWEEMAETRTALSGKLVRKEAGCSWVT
ncbi:TPR-like protein [Dioscorea alata]|uniref:TPR-like protein n=1 Tax=Dioscorea alata TaxID=55571 RepID=A0ACB7TTQ7_DIOAL|nr:TPR-like protein [Dioscorea alata]